MIQKTIVNHVEIYAGSEGGDDYVTCLVTPGKGQFPNVGDATLWIDHVDFKFTPERIVHLKDMLVEFVEAVQETEKELRG